MLGEEGEIFVALVLSAMFKCLVHLTMSPPRQGDTKHPEENSEEKTLVGTLSKISIYPVKSMKGIELQTAWCDFVGLRTNEQLRDRLGWLIVQSLRT